MSEYENPFIKCLRLGRECRSKMGVDYTAMFRNDPTRNSRLSAPGTFVNDRNQISKIKNSDPDVHRNSCPIERPLLVTTISADDEDESKEIEEGLEPLVVEPQAAPVAGIEVEEPMHIEIGTRGIVRLDTGVTFLATTTQVDPLTIDGGEEFGLLEISREEFTPEEAA